MLTLTNTSEERYLASHRAFIDARRSKDPNLLNKAQNVLCVIGTEAYTVEDILLECNVLDNESQDFAGWVTHTDRLLKKCILDARGIEKDAFQLVADQTFYTNPQIVAALEEVAERQKASELMKKINQSAMTITYMRFDE